MKKKVYCLILTTVLLILNACGKNTENDPAVELFTVETSPAIETSMEKTSLTVIQETEAVSAEIKTEEQNIPEEMKPIADEPETEAKTVAQGDVEKALSEWKAKGDNNYYIVPDSSTRLLTEEELNGFSKTELRLARNEIAARHGWDFDDPVIKSYFITQKWYEPAEGKNDQVQYSAVESANITLTDEVESREEKQADYRRLNQLTELKPGDIYEFSYGEYVFTLETTKQNYTNSEKFFYVMTLCENTNRVKEHHYINKEENKVMVYNRESESFLIFCRTDGENDYGWSEVYLLNKDGANKTQEIGRIICAYTKDAICITENNTDIDHVTYYEWLFLEGNEWVRKGKAVAEICSYTVKEEFSCYAVEKEDFFKVKISPGETLHLVSLDNRYDNVHWFEFARNDKSVFLSCYWNFEKDYLGICEDGRYPWQYFEETEFGPAG